MVPTEELVEEMRLLRASLDRFTGALNAQANQQPLRNVYTCEQFATEVLCGNRGVEWVQDKCKAKRIKTVARRPWIIPQSEALRFIGAVNSV